LAGAWVVLLIRVEPVVAAVCGWLAAYGARGDIRALHRDGVSLAGPDPDPDHDREYGHVDHRHYGDYDGQVVAHPPTSTQNNQRLRRLRPLSQRDLDHTPGPGTARDFHGRDGIARKAMLGFAGFNAVPLDVDAPRA
jgi:hypothetical protein